MVKLITVIELYFLILGRFQTKLLKTGFSWIGWMKILEKWSINPKKQKIMLSSKFFLIETGEF